MGYVIRDINNNRYPVGSKLQIGNDPRNQVVLADPQSTPFHATLLEAEGVLYVTDGTGGTATYVNQALIQGTVPLRPGDQLALGNTLFTIEALNAPPSVAVPAIVAPVAAPQQPPAAPAAGLKVKKRKGCGGWILTALLVFVSECVLLGVIAAILVSTDVEIRGGFQDLKAWFSSDTSAFDQPTDVNQVGPKVINLQDRWLVNNYSSSFSQYQENTAEGLSQENTPSSVSFQIENMQQDVSGWSSYSHVIHLKDGEPISENENAVVNGTLYSATDTCTAEADPDAADRQLDSTPYYILTSLFTGHVKLVEEGVTINGVVADRYVLRKDNFVDSDSIIEFVSGDLYRAREGGYLVQLDYVINVAPQSRTLIIGQDFSETEPAQIRYHFDRTYVPDGTLTIKTPEACAGQIQ